MKRSVALLLVSTALLSGCSSSEGTRKTETATHSIPADSNKDPRIGWAVISDSVEDETVFKRCDGTTLLYRYNAGHYGGNASGLAAIADSPECQPV